MELEKEKSAEGITPWGMVGYITYKRTYARRLDANDVNSKTEEFTDSVKRVIDACRDQLNVGFTPEEEELLQDKLLKLKGSVAGRFWWQLGTPTVDKLGLLSLQNCAFTVINDPVKPFVWAMDALMLGSGYKTDARIKQGELLENPTSLEDNQQPSLDSNIFEGSTTNLQIQTDNAEDSNENTSALPKIDKESMKNFAEFCRKRDRKMFFGDDIV